MNNQQKNGGLCLLAYMRVSSRIGGGMQDALVNPLTFHLDHLSEHDNFAGIANDLWEMTVRSILCTDFNPENVSMDPILHSVEDSQNIDDPEDNWYIYHSDHLSSSSFLTDASGDPTQHLQYLPFGETFIEQRSTTSYYTPYTFSAKERDAETGYSFFGARYYDADISIWLSVDPMADKYPSMSAYMYCAGNPVMLVDPDGREMNPIYDTEGNFRGTDDLGLQGQAIVLKKEDFKQGMSHEEASKKNLGVDGLNGEAAMKKLLKHYGNLKTRPDYNGYLTLDEANEWYRKGTGEPLFANLSLINLDFLQSTGDKDVGQEKVINLFFVSANLNDALVYGQIKLKRYPHNQVRAFADEYDFELHNAWNPLCFVRNMLTGFGRIYSGKGIKYNINLYGSKTLSTYPWVKN